MKIACCTLIRDVVTPFTDSDLILGLNSAKKDKALVLPGGKFDPDLDDDYRYCAIRELKEETNVVVIDPDNYALLYHGLGGSHKYYIYIFQFFDFGYTNMCASPEGIPEWVTPEKLLKEGYKPYRPIYHLVLDAMK